MSSFIAFHKQGYAAMTHLDWWKSLWSWEATAVYVGWYMWTVACWAFLPGQEIDGVELRNGERLKYKINGRLRHLVASAMALIFVSRAAFSTMALSLIVIAATTFFKGVGPLLYITDNYTQLITAAAVMSFVQVSRSWLLSSTYSRLISPLSRPASSTSKVTRPTRC